jgi:hypothetical protein
MNAFYKQEGAGLDSFKLKQSSPKFGQRGLILSPTFAHTAKWSSAHASTRRR